MLIFAIDDEPKMLKLLHKAIINAVPDTKIVFVTGYDDYAMEAFRVHADGYLLKPVDTAHDLFERVGADETISQSVFFNRAARLEDAQVLAYDSSTVSTYGLNHGRARHGYNKDGDGLETDKLFTFYSMSSRQPVCYMTVPGNMCPDEAGTYGVHTCITHEFTRTRKYASKKKGLDAGAAFTWQILKINFF